MFLSTLTLICALSISGTAAYFSIVGLATMFPGAQLSIIIMGSVLEVGKIVAAVWLHSNWQTMNKFIRAYLSFSVVILMLITSMGIFGFLSKSYIVHEAEADKEQAQIQQIENQIDREKGMINRYEDSIESTKKSKSSDDNRTVGFIRLEEGRILKLHGIAQQTIATEQSSVDKWSERAKELDGIINEINSKGGIFSNKKKKLAEEQERQGPEREKLASSISKAEGRIQEIKDDSTSTINEIKENIKRFQSAVIKSGSEDEKVTELVVLINKSLSKIEGLEAERFEIKKKVNALNVEVGPVRYIVELFNDFGAEDLGLGTAVRLVILALIFVFDPLAVLLVVVTVGALKGSSKFKLKEESKLKKSIQELERQSAEKLKEIQKSAESKAASLQQSIRKEGVKVRAEIAKQKSDAEEEAKKLKQSIKEEGNKAKEEAEELKKTLKKKQDNIRSFAFGDERKLNPNNTTHWNSEDN
jgi:hypothetical protein